MKKMLVAVIAVVLLAVFAVAANAAVGTVVYATKVESAPNLNEIDDSWGSPAIVINSKSPNTELFRFWTEENRVLTANEWSRYVNSGMSFEPEDYDVELYYLWDSKYLYVAMKTKDLTFCGHSNGWDGDGIQFWLQPLEGVANPASGCQVKAYDMKQGEKEGGEYYYTFSGTYDYYWTLGMDDYSVSKTPQTAGNAALSCDTVINTDTDGVLQCTIAIPLSNFGLNPKKADLEGFEFGTAVLRISSVGTFETRAYAGWLAWGKYFNDTKVDTLNTVVLTSSAHETTPPATETNPATEPNLDGVSSWAKEEVEAGIKEGLVPAELQQNYTTPVTRGQVAQMFINLLEKATGKTVDEIMAEKGVAINENAFTDTTDKAVLAANALGIINGTGNGKFSPNGTLKRAQIAAIINRVAKVMGVETEGYTHEFTDITDNYKWADSELGWPVYAGIINGVGGGKFNPGGDLTTEQAILITYRALGALK